MAVSRISVTAGQNREASRENTKELDRHRIKLHNLDATACPAIISEESLSHVSSCDRCSKDLNSSSTVLRLRTVLEPAEAVCVPTNTTSTAVYVATASISPDG